MIGMWPDVQEGEICESGENEILVNVGDGETPSASRSDDEGGSLCRSSLGIDWIMARASARLQTRLWLETRIDGAHGGAYEITAPLPRRTAPLPHRTAPPAAPYRAPSAAFCFAHA